MICSNCKQECDRIHIEYDNKLKKIVEYCNKCNNLPVFCNPDVTLVDGQPYWDEHLSDEKHRYGRWIYSKKQKARILKELNLVEVGDRKNFVTGKVTPYIKDVEKRRKYFLDNFGE